MAQSITVNKWGNNLAIRIPKYAEQNLGLHAGDRVTFYYKDNIIFIEAEKTSSQQFEEWLKMFDRGEASLGDMPTT